MESPEKLRPRAKTPASKEVKDDECIQREVSSDIRLPSTRLVYNDDKIITVRLGSKSEHCQRHVFIAIENTENRNIFLIGRAPKKTPTTTEDTTDQGYDIPKGTVVMNNILAVHNDPKYWKNPSEFFPEYFLTQEGTKFEKPEYFIPFSIGKRSCPGETLAVVELFLYVTSTLQRFIVTLPDGDKPNFDGVFELTWDAKHHKFRLIPIS
ncbi:putative inactive cytochrome P450 2G1 [Tachypleus tridentatus]|uniref:putative inactive cytochrome P450 2G1 n=1 Tax=Tachypleus tridentatus TaxID=6853 RepID=UPI003FCF2B7F